MIARSNGVSKVVNALYAHVQINGRAFVGAALIVACLGFAHNAFAREEFQRGSTEVTTVAGKTLAFVKSRFQPRDRDSTLPAGNGLAINLESGWRHRLPLECIRSIRLHGDNRRMDVEYVFQGKTNTLSGTYSSDIDDPAPSFEGEHAFGTQKFRLSDLASIRFLDDATNTDVLGEDKDWKACIKSNYGAQITLKDGKAIRVCDVEFASQVSRTWKSPVSVPGIPGAYENRSWSGLDTQSKIRYRIDGTEQHINTNKLRQIGATEDGGLQLTSDVDGSIMSIRSGDLVTVAITGRINGYFKVFVPLKEIERMTIVDE